MLCAALCATVIVIYVTFYIFVLNLTHYLKIMLREILTIFFIALCSAAMAQEHDEDFRLFKSQSEEFEQSIVESDTLLFYRLSHQTHDLYGDITAYNFSFIDFARRGVAFYDRQASVDGLGVRLTNLNILRRLGLEESAAAGIAGRGESSLGGLTRLTTTEGVPLSGAQASVFFSGRGYLGGARATIHHFMRNGWSLSAYISARVGAGLYVEGVSQNSGDVGLRLSRELRGGGIVNMLFATTLSYRGLRSASTEEAFRLTGDNLYNPTWGYQGGDVRNSRVRCNCIPFLMGSFHKDITHNTSLLVAVGGEWGKTKNSALGWYGTATPRPDNYRLMPSYYTDIDVAQAVEERWRAEDSRYTQVNWAELYTINSMAGGEARYAVEQRVNRTLSGKLSVEFTTYYGDNLTLRYGVKADINSNRYYKEMDDLLGADYLTDIDYYLMDDDTYSLNLQNDMRQPNRRVVEGDRFSYDYALTERNVAAFAEAEYQSDRWHLRMYASVGSHAIYRRGYFEKEIFAGQNSFGRSRTITYSPFRLKAYAAYAFSAKHHLSAAVMYAHESPYAASLFYNPQYNTRTIDNPTAEKIFAIDASYRLRTTNVDLSVNAFLHCRRDGVDVQRSYDDLSTIFSDVVTTDISTLSYGVELASEVRLSRKWRATLALGAGRYVYSNNPLVSHYSDTDNTLVAHSESLMDGRYIGGVPQLNGSATITYLDYSGWAISAGVNLAALRYVEPSFVRRSERVVMQSAVSEEISREFLSQERFNDACSVDLSLSRWFNIRRSRLSLTLSVKNLLGGRNIVYGGYESMRIRHYRSGDVQVYRPQDNLITYAYPRTIYFVATWRF